MIFNSFLGMKRFINCIFWNCKLIVCILGMMVSGKLLSGQNNSVQQLRREANTGNTGARLKMAECFALGIDCPENQDSVLHYLKPLLENKHPEACFLIGNTYLRNGSQRISEGLKYLEIAANAGSIQAVIVLLEVYSGKDASGPFANAALAARKNDLSLFKTAGRAREINDPVLSFYLGMCYLEGRGTARNDSLALKWLEHSADWAYCPAQLVLGDFWFFGKSVKGYDLQKAQEYYTAAKQNNKCSIAQQGDGLEGEIWVSRSFNMLWNATWDVTCLFGDMRIELPVPEVKTKDFIKNRYPK